MSVTPQTSDAEVLQLLRTTGPMGVRELALMTRVTPTAVRERLARLLAQGLVRREPVRGGRGRPRHRYELTEQGLRLTGSNFMDLATAMWREISGIEDPDLRRMLLWRVVRALAHVYGEHVHGDTVEERMRAISDLLAERRVPFTVEQLGDVPVLRAHACPYPNLANQDRTICALERVLFSELLHQDIHLAQCRLDGAPCCQFQPYGRGGIL